MNSTPQARQDIFGKLRKRMPQEAAPMASLAGLAAAEPPRLDVSHPPLALRERFVHALPRQLPQITVSGFEREALEQELAPLKPAIQRKLIDGYIISITY